MLKDVANEGHVHRRWWFGEEVAPMVLEKMLHQGDMCISHEPSYYIAEGRPCLFLPMKVPKGRQNCLWVVSTTFYGGSFDGPTGLVPTTGKISAIEEQFRTRFLFSICVWGPLCKFQGLVCNF
ncbi:hypothetical protein ZWY2020_035582 [Hordeum vulgare]|nr:hypothetical protein ZWY2020_035582 [Hordeum vulgare]